MSVWRGGLALGAVALGGGRLLGLARSRRRRRGLPPRGPSDMGLDVARREYRRRSSTRSTRFPRPKATRPHRGRGAAFVPVPARFDGGRPRQSDASVSGPVGCASADGRRTGRSTSDAMPRGVFPVTRHGSRARRPTRPGVALARGRVPARPRWSCDRGSSSSTACSARQGCPEAMGGGSCCGARPASTSIPFASTSRASRSGACTGRRARAEAP